MSLARVLPAREGSASDALALGSRLAEIARATGSVTYGAVITHDRAVALGRWQHAPRVLDLAACERARIPVLRRSTSGTAIALSPGATAVLALALPSLTALMPDARGPTTLNRNVRGWLRGITALGPLAHYFGREWLSIGKRPAGVLALSAPRDGTIVLELWIGIDEPVALPAVLASPRERALDRWLGRAPAAWSALCNKPLTLEALDAVAARAASHHGLRCERVDGPIALPAAALPEPKGPARWLEPCPCAIGWIDLGAQDDGAPWLGGDLLVGESAREAMTEALRGDDPMSLEKSLVDLVEHDVVLGASVDELRACGARWAERVRSDPS